MGAYFEGIEDDIQFDGILSTDGVVYFACVGKRIKQEDRDDEEEGT
jgi:hypothetical protein